jgi:uncharacterized membrane protein
MRVEQSITIGAPREVIWDYISDPVNYLEFMDGLTRWEISGEKKRGLGARYRVLLRIGSADVGGLIEVVEWSPPGDLAWSSVTGLDQRWRWRLRERSERSTRVTFRFAYGVAGGGFFALIAERVAARPLRQRFRRSLENVRKAIEVGETRGRRKRAEVGSSR